MRNLNMLTAAKYKYAVNRYSFSNVNSATYIKYIC